MYAFIHPILLYVHRREGPDRVWYTARKHSPTVPAHYTVKILMSLYTNELSIPLANGILVYVSLMQPDTTFYKTFIMSNFSEHPLGGPGSAQRVSLSLQKGMTVAWTTFNRLLAAKLREIGLRPDTAFG